MIAGGESVSIHLGLYVGQSVNVGDGWRTVTLAEIGKGPETFATRRRGRPGARGNKEADMTLGVGARLILPGAACLLLTAFAAICSAQIDIHIHTATGPEESHIGNLTGHSKMGKQLYRRY